MSLKWSGLLFYSIITHPEGPENEKKSIRPQVQIPKVLT